jgi:hypothetical protein
MVHRGTSLHETTDQAHAMVGMRRERIESFVEWVERNITGDEKGQAQIFLDRLFQAFGQPGCLDVGGTPEFRIRKAREDGGGTAFADYVWKPIVLIEMKKRGTDLARYFRQAFDYWVRLVPGRPRYVVLCNFDEFWVYDFETQMDSPVDQLQLAELPRRNGPLAFLFPTPERPVFGNDQEAVTRDAADRLVTCFNKLVIRGIDRALAQRFILQSLVALFSQNIGLLDQYMFTRLLDECDEPRKSYDLLGQLFFEMNTPGRTLGGRFKGVDYFDGGLFAEPARIELYPDEVAQLRKAAEANWSTVRPEIFGTLFEHSVHQAERRAYGAHFTHPADIMKIVGPTIVEPWRELIENARTIKRLLELRKRLTEFIVLDPACGSGNFLYIAYRELKRLESRIFERIDEISTRKEEQRLLGFVTANQFYGIDINPLGVELAKVTMMIARKLAIDELKMNERALPLDNLDRNFIVGDALIRSELMGLDGARRNWRRPLFVDGRPVPVDWPKADVIIGNPPFNGAKKLKPDLGPDYVNAVRQAHPEVPGMADYCVFWIRKAHDHLPDCTADDPVAGRAGLVGTQNIRNNKSRVGGLDHIAANGTIIEAVDNQPWSGEANVHVSIVNWVKHPKVDPRWTRTERARIRTQRLIPEKGRLWFKVEAAPGKKKIRKKGTGPASKEYELAYRHTAHITSTLSDETDVTGAVTLSCNKTPQFVYQGVTPDHSGFVLSPTDRLQLIKKDPGSAKVVFPYLIGREVVTGDGVPRRFIIDFGDRDILDAKAHPAAFDRIQSLVLPDVREKAEQEHEAEAARKQHLGKWWQHWRDRSDMKAAVAALSGRYITGSRTQRWPFVFCFMASSVLPGDKIQVFAFDDDYSFGILQSIPHLNWYRAKAARLKNELDFNYSSESVFETFPWPQTPSARQIAAVAEAAREVRRVRNEALKGIKGGLRAVYRTLGLPGKNPLKDAHGALDTAAIAAYGFSPTEDLLAQLLDLNYAVARRIRDGQQVTAPGIPPRFRDPARLITDDCIRP